MSRFAWVLTVALLPGCSIALQNKPATAGHASAGAAPCSSSRKLPWVDAGITAAEVVVGVTGFAISRGIGFDRREDLGTSIAGVALFAAVVQLASSVNGFEDAAHCGSNRAALASR